jgi:hypothetical protein
MKTQINDGEISERRGCGCQAEKKGNFYPCFPGYNLYDFHLSVKIKKK